MLSEGGAGGSVTLCPERALGGGHGWTCARKGALRSFVADGFICVMQAEPHAAVQLERLRLTGQCEHRGSAAGCKHEAVGVAAQQAAVEHAAAEKVVGLLQPKLWQRRQHCRRTGMGEGLLKGSVSVRLLRG